MDATVGNVLGGPVQIAYAVDDVAAAARRWATSGVGPFFVREHIEVRNVRRRGEAGTFDHSSAYAQWGSLMVELICQHDGGALPVGATRGLHHMAFFVDDIVETATSLTEQGMVEVLYAEGSAGLSFAMHDAVAQLGHLVEIYQRTVRLAAFYAMVRDASVGWDGRDPIRYV